MPASLLPAVGWTLHAEQIDAASLAAHAWHMKTTMHGGLVLTSMLQPLTDARVIAQLEEIYRRQQEHRKSCTDPNCDVGESRDGGLPISKLCPNGKFDPSVLVFVIIPFDGLGMPIIELRQVTESAVEAEKNHYYACSVVAGVVSSWTPPKESFA